MNDYDPILFTQRQVFGRDTASGTLSTNDDYNEHIRPFGSPQPPAVEYDMLDYLTNGAGRYATPAVFPIIDDFFNATLQSRSYNSSELQNALGLNTQQFQDASEVAIWQYGTNTTSLDFAERAYIFGTTDFKLDLTNAKFEVTANNNKFITGMQVIALDDNFDFRGGAGPINAVANTVLLPAYDPYELGIDPTNPQNREVPIKFTTSTNGRTHGTSSDPYSHADWVADDLYETAQVSIKGTVSGAAKLALGISQFLNPVSTTLAGSYLRNIDSDPFFRYERGNSKVIYGTPDSDDIGVFRDIGIEFNGSNPFAVPNTPSLSNLLMVGGDGNDMITSYAVGDELLGGNDNDVLNGGGGDDTLNGGADNDNLDGGKGEDIAIFTDDFSNYNYSISQDGKTITFNHVRGTQTDGTDTLRNIEFAEFQGNQLEPLPSIATNTETGNITGVASATASPPRIIPLPLEDGIANTVSEQVYVEPPVYFTSDPVTPPYVSLTAPTSMLDGDIDYTLNISPYKPDTQYNISYIFDTSGSMDESELQTAKDAYIDLINYYIDTGVADKSNFSVISFSRFANPYFNLTGEQAISIIQNLTTAPTGERTKYNEALYEGLNFLSQSSLNLLNAFYRRFQLNREWFQLASS